MSEIINYKKVLKKAWPEIAHALGNDRERLGNIFNSLVDKAFDPNEEQICNSSLNFLKRLEGKTSDQIKKALDTISEQPTEEAIREAVESAIKTVLEESKQIQLQSPDHLEDSTIKNTIQELKQEESDEFLPGSSGYDLIRTLKKWGNMAAKFCVCILIFGIVILLIQRGSSDNPNPGQEIPQLNVATSTLHPDFEEAKALNQSDAITKPSSIIGFEAKTSMEKVTPEALTFENNSISAEKNVTKKPVQIQSLELIDKLDKIYDKIMYPTYSIKGHMRVYNDMSCKMKGLSLNLSTPLSREQIDKIKCLGDILYFEFSGTAYVDNNIMLLRSVHGNLKSMVIDGTKMCSAFEKMHIVLENINGLVFRNLTELEFINISKNCGKMMQFFEQAVIASSIRKLYLTNYNVDSTNVDSTIRMLQKFKTLKVLKFHGAIDWKYDGLKYPKFSFKLYALSIQLVTTEKDLEIFGFPGVQTALALLHTSEKSLKRYDSNILTPVKSHLFKSLSKVWRMKANLWSYYGELDCSFLDLYSNLYNATVNVVIQSEQTLVLNSNCKEYRESQVLKIRP